MYIPDSFLNDTRLMDACRFLSVIGFEHQFHILFVSVEVNLLSISVYRLFVSLCLLNSY
ncbi:hypothetical protein Hanom_Chr10g00923231 [Helianthus anomalus]